MYPALVVMLPRWIVTGHLWSCNARDGRERTGYGGRKKLATEKKMRCCSCLSSISDAFQRCVKNRPKNRCVPSAPGKLVKRNYAIIYYRKSDWFSSPRPLSAPAAPTISPGGIFTQIAHKSLSHSRPNSLAIHCCWPLQLAAIHLNIASTSNPIHFHFAPVAFLDNCWPGRN